nr:uncharacterized protein LOC109180409 [Ipomoea batatas]
MDTMSWFSNNGVELKIEEDGRVFPVSNSSSSIIDCLMSEAKKRGDWKNCHKCISHYWWEVHCQARETFY